MTEQKQVWGTVYHKFYGVWHFKSSRFYVPCWEQEAIENWSEQSEEQWMDNKCN